MPERSTVVPFHKPVRNCRHGSLRSLLIGLIAVCTGACSKSVQSHVNLEGGVVVRHEWRSDTKGKWKIECWLDGSASPVWYPVNISFRLTPEKLPAQLPPVKARLKITGTGAGGETREALSELTF